VLSDCPAHAGLAGSKSAANNSVRPANHDADKLPRLLAIISLLQTGKPLSKNHVLVYRCSITHSLQVIAARFLFSRQRLAHGEPP
jgi:hypothetical protein